MRKGEFIMSSIKRIAVNVGGGFVPGLDAVVTGVVRAAGELGWTVAGIRDGFDGLLFPDRYPDGGLVPLTDRAGDVLGNATRTNPFCVRHVTAENEVEEVDLDPDLGRGVGVVAGDLDHLDPLDRQVLLHVRQELII